MVIFIISFFTKKKSLSLQVSSYSMNFQTKEGQIWYISNPHHIYETYRYDIDSQKVERARLANCTRGENACYNRRIQEAERFVRKYEKKYQKRLTLHILIPN